MNLTSVANIIISEWAISPKLWKIETPVSSPDLLKHK